MPFGRDGRDGRNDTVLSDAKMVVFISKTFAACHACSKNAQVVTSLQTSCYTSVHKLSTSCARTACSQFVVTSLKQAVNNL